MRYALLAAFLAFSGLFAISALAMAPAAYPLGSPAAAGAVTITLHSVDDGTVTDGDVTIVTHLTLRVIARSPVAAGAVPKLFLEDGQGRSAVAAVEDSHGVAAESHASVAFLPGNTFELIRTFKVPARGYSRDGWMIRIGKNGSRIMLR